VAEFAHPTRSAEPVDEVGRTFGVTRERIRQIENNTQDARVAAGGAAPERLPLSRLASSGLRAAYCDPAKECLRNRSNRVLSAACVSLLFAVTTGVRASTGSWLCAFRCTFVTQSREV
jgi:hypothetical protein